jgi:hypothetical protein
VLSLNLSLPLPGQHRFSFTTSVLFLRDSSNVTTFHDNSMNVTNGLAYRVGQIIAMATPLIHANDSALNSANSSANHDEYEVESYTTTTTTTDTDSDGPPSSPFVANVSDPSNYENDENRSPSKQVSRLMSKSPIERGPVSPLKMLKSRSSPTKVQSPQKVSDPMRSPRKLSSPEKRFPVKVSTSPGKRSVLEERTLTVEDVLRDNEGLTKAIQILEDEDSVLIHEDTRSDGASESKHEEHISDDTLTSLRGAEDDGPNMVCSIIRTSSLILVMIFTLGILSIISLFY